MRFEYTKRSQQGAALVEYALLIGLIALIAAGAIPRLGQRTSNNLSNTACFLAGGSEGSDNQCIMAPPEN